MRQLFLDVGRSRAITPPLWTVEIGNVLLVAERRNRIEAVDRMRAMRILGELPVSIETPVRERVWRDLRDRRLASADDLRRALS